MNGAVTLAARVRVDAPLLRQVFTNIVRNGVEAIPIGRSGSTSGSLLGLALAIVKKIVIEHGGEIAYREDGGKPTFTDYFV
jgi:signal transduction histidine kinase